MPVTRRKAIAITSAGVAGILGAPVIAQSKQKVVLGQPSEGFIYIPIYVARTKGFFEQESLDAEVITFSKGGAEALAAVLGGQSDIYVGSPTVQLRAQEKGQLLKSFAAVQTQFGSDLVLSADVAKRIDLANLSDPKAKAAALKGLTIAVAGPGSLTDLMVRHIAQFGGLNPDRDMTITPIGGGGSMLAAFGQKRIDGYALSAPTSTTGIERFGGAMLFNFAKGEYPPFANFLFYTLIARNDWIAGKPEMAQKVVRALWKGLRFAKTNPDEAREAVRPFFTQVPKGEFDMAWALSLPSFGDNPKIDEAGMLQNYGFLQEAERRPVTVPVAESYTNAIVDAVAPSMK
ncbi:ABC transporter substrate-binding protein [Bradyrhizobium sp. LTSP849]|uniref:ABC transporter substrate-binding protein n=1 Tax=Bradyrhizobium sp. LTSP849 TaxID=1615890 RepID=UPI0005D262E5|nr:ABC transporter substrate-binding protein [Bradyrhizobium sp. LTSP849]